VAMALFGSLFIPGSLGTFFKVRDLCIDYPEYFQRSHCVLIIICAMYCAWMKDTGAYFVGSKFGKRKLAPRISPKKSVEGAIGGVVINAFFCVVSFLVCDKFFFHLDTLNVWMMLGGSVVLSVLGMCGDLSASVIKRNFGEKDFGNLFPGHGGVLDRIDSFLVTMPALYVIIEIALAFAAK
ncbi:MAG: phosphatidate cytidylyltransferase, partial [Clostridia bacterium]|nr:phosphatidate cytidylyltransferase [Clostridia bacterium]